MKNIRKFLPILILGVLSFSLWYSGILEELNLENFKLYKNEIIQLRDSHMGLVALGYSLSYILIVSLSLPVASLFSLLGGFLFGKWVGTFLVVFSATIGASIIFLIAKSSFGESLRAKAGPLYQKVDASIHQGAFTYLLSIRLLPIFPFFLVNIVFALFNIPLRTFVSATFLGIIPGTFVYVNLGQTLGDIETLEGLISPDTLLALSLLALFVVIPTVFKKLKKTKSIPAAILALSCLTFPAHADSHYDAFLSLYEGLLQKYTFEDRVFEQINYTAVDYDLWSRDHEHEKALQYLKKIDPKQFETVEEKKAFWINAYNFLTIDLVTRSGERESLKNLGGLLKTAWNGFYWPIGGQKYSLDDIEHKILRPMGDARIHFAINCASLSCPDLRKEAYKDSKLGRQLDAQVQKTLQDKSKGIRFAGAKVYLSKIMSWFVKDFDKGNIKGWIRDHAGIDIPASVKIVYMNYDWRLNKQRD